MSALDGVTSQVAEAVDGYDGGGAWSAAGSEQERGRLLRDLLHRVPILLPQHLRGADSRHFHRARRRRPAGGTRS